jgi:thioredoxin 1
MLSPIMDELSNEFTNINFGKINVDDAGNLATKYSVQSIPTVFLFKDGQVKNKFLGFMPKELIIKFLKSN